MKSPWQLALERKIGSQGKERQESLAVTFWLLFNENRYLGPNDFLFKMTAIHERRPVGIKNSSILHHKHAAREMMEGWARAQNF